MDLGNNVIACNRAARAYTCFSIYRECGGLTTRWLRRNCNGDVSITVTAETPEPKAEPEARGCVWNALPNRIKENPLAAVLAALAGAVITISAFSDSAKNLFGLVHEATVPRVAGTRVTPVLADPYDRTIHCRLVFAICGKAKSRLAEI
jgi:hypothetical protein